MKRWSLSVALTLLIMPGTFAESVSGDLLASTLLVPSRGEISGEPLAVLTHGDLSSASLRIESARLHVVEYEKRYFTLATGNVAPEEARGVHHNFTGAALVASDRETNSIIGFYPGDEASLSFVGTLETTVEARDHSIIADFHEVREDREIWWYYEELEQPHLLVSGTGRAMFEGAWITKIR